MLRIGIVAGEPSGDNLGATLMASLKKSGEEIEVEGIGGENLIKEGCRSLHPMERLSVMGIFEIAGRYLELRNIHKQTTKYFLENPPDIFIGIDSPDFTLPMEETLHAAGIKTVHYVSPTVWAWRQYRIKNIAKSTDLMMTLFPFEVPFYQQHNVKVECVGHPLANEIPLLNDRDEAREELQLNKEDKIIAILPGSRHGEITRLAEPFFKACLLCLKAEPGLKFIAALRDKKSSELFERLKNEIAPELEVTIVTGKTRTALIASNTVLIASGTATLEAMLVKRPMVVAYRIYWLTYELVRHFVTFTYMALPNLIAEERLVPEFLQNDCEPEKLAEGLLSYIQDEEKVRDLEERFTHMHKQLMQRDDSRASDAILSLVRQ